MDIELIYYSKGKLKRTKNPRRVKIKLLHREDGPAVIYEDGFKEYYIYGLCLPYKKWLKVRKWI